MSEDNKRLLVPVVRDPHVLVVGNPADGFRLYGPTPKDDIGEFREARERYIEEQGAGISWLLPLTAVKHLIPIDGDWREPPCPTEDLRAEFWMAVGAAEVAHANLAQTAAEATADGCENGEAHAWAIAADADRRALDLAKKLLA